MEEENVFLEAPIGKAVRTMIFPTIISQIIMVIYNMADTWYVGLTGNAYAVAAVSLYIHLLLLPLRDTGEKWRKT